MMDDIVIYSCLEALLIYLMDMCDCLNFVTASVVIFFFAMLLMWKKIKEDV